MTIIINDETLNEIGYILYKEEDKNPINIIEVKTFFDLRRAKIKNKHMLNSKIYSTDNHKNIIYIEQLGKWYYNEELYNSELIEIELYDSLDDILNNHPELNENINDVRLHEDPQNDLIFYGYILYDYLNYNYILAHEYKSIHNIDSDKKSARKSHITKIYYKENNPDIKYIKKIDKWYYNSKKISISDLKLNLYNSYEDTDLNESRKELTNAKENLHEIDPNQIFKSENLGSLNQKSYMKDLKFRGFILFEFIEDNKISYKIYDNFEDADEHESKINQIYKCYCKRSNDKIIYIKRIKKWFYDENNITTLVNKESKITIKKENNIIEPKIKTKSIDDETDRINVIKRRKLLLKGWIYYELIDENTISARHYKSSNKLLERLENSNGFESQIFKSKTSEYAYIKNINKWILFDDINNEEDNVTKIYEEKEIFLE